MVYRRLLAVLLYELELGGQHAPRAVADEIGEALLVAYLHGKTHNFSSRLARPDAAPSSIQQRLAEEFIAAHWNQPLSVEDMAKASNVSARSIFRTFREKHGCSPFEYVKRVRLQNAQKMLQQDDLRLTVTGVALKCGFHSLGHFARSYRTAFGELPSDTLLRARR